MRASNTLAAAFSPGSVLTMCATTGSPVSGICSVSGSAVRGVCTGAVVDILVDNPVDNPVDMLLTVSVVARTPPVNQRRNLLPRGSTDWIYTRAMPLYEFKCRTCETVFEERRPMAEANNPATCPDGHSDAVRMLSVFASVGGDTSSASSLQSMAPSGGSCCGGGCCS